MEKALPKFLKLSRDEQKASLEALIFSGEETISFKTLFSILIFDDGSIGEHHDNPLEIIAVGSDNENSTEFNEEYIKELVQEINDELVSSNRPYMIVDYANGYQYATRPEYGELVQQLIKAKTKRRLSQASMEVLAIITYKQPVSKPEIEQVRGVNSNEIVNSLIEKNLIKIAGRSEALGKPLLYSTTQEFLRVFGLTSLDELPKLRELEELANSDYQIAEPDSQITLNILESGELDSISFADNHLINDDSSIIYKDEIKIKKNIAE